MLTPPAHYSAAFSSSAPESPARRGSQNNPLARDLLYSPASARNRVDSLQRDPWTALRQSFAVTRICSTLVLWSVKRPTISSSAAIQVFFLYLSVVESNMFIGIVSSFSCHAVGGFPSRIIFVLFSGGIWFRTETLNYNRCQVVITTGITSITVCATPSWHHHHRSARLRHHQFPSSSPRHCCRCQRYCGNKRFCTHSGTSRALFRICVVVHL